nr:cytochrome c biogenesis heme-transporting ATPase CcmA [Alteromonas facilis]
MNQRSTTKDILLPRLRAVELTCVRRDRVLFETLSFEIASGELVYLTGQNGAGKTSLLRTLVGFHQPQNGDVLFNGASISDASVKRSYARELIYIGHKSAVDPHASAFENCQFWCAQHGIKVAPERVYDVLATLGLVGLEDIPCVQLSAGQNRRVALARLWLKPEALLWVLDEPFTALDVHGIELVELHIKSFTENGGSVLLTSHQTLQHVKQNKTLDLEYRI